MLFRSVRRAALVFEIVRVVLRFEHVEHVGPIGLVGFHHVGTGGVVFARDGERGGGAMDRDAVFHQRIDEFNQKTRPVVDFYKSKGLLITIDGTADRNRVTEDIINKLLALAKGS